MDNIRKFKTGLKIEPKTPLTADSQGELEVNSSDGKLNYHNGSSESPIVTESHSATLTNKTLTSPVINGGDINGVTLSLNDSDSAFNLEVQSTSTLTADHTLTIDVNNADRTLSLTGNAVITGNEVSGPASATNDAVARFDGTTGKLLDNSTVTISDAGIMSGATQLNVDNLRLDGNTLSSTNTDGDIVLDPNGTGDVVIDNLELGQNDISATSGNLNLISTSGVVNLVADTGFINIGSTNFVTNPTGDVDIIGSLSIDNIDINGNTISSTNANGNVIIDPNGTGDIQLTVAGAGATVDIGSTSIQATDAGILTITGQLNADNLRLDGNTVSSTDTNGNIIIDPNGTGDIQLTVAGAGATVDIGSTSIQADSAGILTITGQLNTDNLRLDGNTISSTNTDGNIVLDPNGTGIIDVQSQLTATGALRSNTSLIVEETGAGTDIITIQAPSSIASSYTLTLPVDDGTSGQVLSTDGSGVLSWSNASSSSTNSTLLSNLGLSTSVGSNALTISLKQDDGSTDPSTGSDSVDIAFRSSTATSGAYNVRSVTSALSMVISSGSGLGHINGKQNPIYVYALDNSGTVELAVSSVKFSEHIVQSTTAEGGAGNADSSTTLYSTTARSNVPIRLLGRLLSTQTTAGTWASNVSQISVQPNLDTREYALNHYGTSNGYGSTNTKIRKFSNALVDIDSSSLWTASNDATNGYSITANRRLKISVTYHDNGSGGTLIGLSLNSNQLTTDIQSITESTRVTFTMPSAANFAGCCQWTGIMNIGDVLRPHTEGGAAGITSRTQLYAYAEEM